MNYTELFNTLSSNNSRLFKESVLLEHKNDETLKRIFKMGLDPFTNYWIRKIPSYVADNSEVEPNHIMDMMERLSSREFTGHDGINHLRNILSVAGNFSSIVEKIIGRDFKCGVSTSTINKIWSGLIFEFPCMLASGSDVKVLSKMKFPAMSQTKWDGMRFNAIIKDKKVTFHSRSGKILDLLGNLEQDFLDIAGDMNVVYDGELWVDDGNNKPLIRKIGNGICTKALKGTISEAEASLIRVTLWDRISFDNWSNGLEKVSLLDRFENLKLEVANKSNKIFITDYQIVNNVEEAEEEFKRLLSEGQEGTILKRLDSFWEDARSKNQIKFKAELSADLLCTGYEPGKPGSKYENSIGSLILTTSDGLIECSCGSGLNDDDRKLDPSEFVGKIIEISYNERIKSSGDKKESLFLPIFNYVRHDKLVANSSKDLK